MRSGRFAALALAVVASAAALGARSQVRDGQAPKPATGTSTLGGVVVTDDQKAQPLRSVVVTLNSADVNVARTVVTDERGRFEFNNLPAGRFLLSASRPAFLTVNYGAARVGRPGVPIAVADGGREHVTVRLPRGAVITGTVRDEFGQPLANEAAFVYALQYQWQNGRRVLGPSPAASSDTNRPLDDRGVYRIYGLPPGEYLVVVTPGIGPAGAGRELTEGDFLRAKREVLGSSSIPTKIRTGAAAVASGTGRSVRWAPVFFPGVTTISQSRTISIAAGEERAGVDLSFIPVPVATIAGRVSTPDGIAPSSVQVNMVPSGLAAPTWATGIGTSIGGFGRVTPAADGAFTITGVAPGDYTLVARVTPPQRGGRTGGAGAPAGTPSASTTYWAVAQVTMTGQDVGAVALALQPSKTLPGRLTFDGADPPDTARARVSLSVVEVVGATIGVPPAAIDADGTFTLSGVTPATYRVDVTGLSRTWALKAATISGRDVLDALLEIGPGTNSGELAITVTDRPSELSGTLQDTAGRPTTEYVVVVFPEDRSRWTWLSRWIHAVRPGTNGRYVATNLPAGRYRLAAVTDVETNEWFDPAFLEKLLPASIAFVIADGERKVQDLRIGR